MSRQGSDLGLSQALPKRGEPQNQALTGHSPARSASQDMVQINVPLWHLIIEQQVTKENEEVSNLNLLFPSVQLLRAKTGRCFGPRPQSKG